MIVSKDEVPIYQRQFDSLIRTNSKNHPTNQKNREALASYTHNPFTQLGPVQHEYDFILNAALDKVDELQWQPSASQHLGQASMFMRSVDKYQDMFVSCMQTPTNAKFMLLHESHKSED